MAPVVERLKVLLTNSSEITAPPLRNGVPSPKDVNAIIRTALDALEGVRITKDIRAELDEVHKEAVQLLRTLKRDALAADPALEQQAQRLVDAALARATASWSPGEKAALRRVFDTLDELAGADGRFNHGDKLAIVAALTKGKGPVERVLVSRVGGAQIDRALDELGVSSDTAARVDDKPRKLTVEQLKQMDADIKLLQEKLQAPADGAGKETLAQFRGVLQKLAGDASLQPPLRNGVPSPKNPSAVIDAALDALEGFRLQGR
jgi:hypothetical protein